MNMSVARLICLLEIVMCSAALPADEPPVVTLTGDWQVEVSISRSSPNEGTSKLTASLHVAQPTVITVEAEKHDSLPLFNAQAAGWIKGARLQGVIAQECTSPGMLEPESLVLRAGPDPTAPQWVWNKDYQFDREWGTVGRLPGGTIGDDQPVFASYRHSALRIDSIVLTQAGKIELRQGEPHVATPAPAALADGDRRLANVFVPGRIAKLEPQHLFPILETAYPEPPKPSPSVAEQLLPKTLEKLRTGSPVRILAWGDSVTDGGYLPDPETNRWQAQFVTRLQQRFPQAKIELVTEAWGGRSTASYLAEPAGGPAQLSGNGTQLPHPT